jgi:4'-phosphopantetheinyl transferase
MENLLSNLTAPPLDNPSVHVWTISLLPPSNYTHLSEVLATDERERAARFRLDHDQERFVITRAALRFILGAYTREKAESVKFAYGNSGKPSLANPHSNLHFSVSHSHELAVIAIAKGRSVGIDIEQIRDDLEAEDLARRFFSAAEIGILERVPPSERLTAFFRIWTGKEAFVKALGDGLARPLNSFDVVLDAAGRPQLTGTRPDLQEMRRWTLHAVEIAEGYASSVAAEGAAEPILFAGNWE